MTSNELATNKTIEARKTIIKNDLDERRTDWYDEHRLEILESNDIDPNNTWNYEDDDNDSGSEPEVD